MVSTVISKYPTPGLNPAVVRTDWYTCVGCPVKVVSPSVTVINGCLCSNDHVNKEPTTYWKTHLPSAT